MHKQKSNSRTFFVVLAAICLLTAPMGAQNSQQQTAPQPLPRNRQRRLNRARGQRHRRAECCQGRRERFDPRLTWLKSTYRFTDRNGKPIKGLKQEQFEVTEDGKVQKVSTFEYNDIEKN